MSPLLKNILRRALNHNRTYLSHLLLAYRSALKNNLLPTLEDLRISLRAIYPISSTTILSRRLWGAAHPYASLYIRQYFSSRYLLTNKKLLCALHYPEIRFGIPLPPIYIYYIRNSVPNISIYKSFILWQLHLLSLYLKGLRRLAFAHISSVASFFRPSTSKPFVFFLDLSRSNIPISKLGQTFTCIDWYRNFSGLSYDDVHYCHNVPGFSSKYLTYRRSPIPLPTTLSSYLCFLRWSIYALYDSTYSLFTNRWYNILVFQEAVDSACLRYTDRSLNGCKYLFNNSRPYPPAWTYEARNQGAEILFYFYSTNSIPFLRRDGTRPLSSMYTLMNWPHYFVWDRYQTRFVHQCQSSIIPRITCVGPIPFSDSLEPYTISHRRSIAFFDVAPKVLSLYAAHCFSTDFYIPRVSQQLLASLVDLAKELDFHIYWKVKRVLGNSIHPRYHSLVNSYLNHPRVHQIPPAVSPFRLIQDVSYVISQPFTSTAKIAASLNVPTVYYDPSYIVSPDDSSCNDIPLVNAHADLRQILIKHLHSIPS